MEELNEGVQVSSWRGGMRGQSLPRGGQGGIKSNKAGKVSNAATASNDGTRG